MNCKIKNNTLEKIYGFILSEAIFVAVELGIPSLLSSKPQSIKSLATALNADELSIKRLIRFLISYDFFEEDSLGKIHLTKEGEYLQENSNSLGNLILSIRDMKYQNIISKLGESIKSGIPAFDLLTGDTFFNHLSKNPEKGKNFSKHMSTLTKDEDTYIPPMIKISEDSLIVDLGGGRGSFLRELLMKNTTCSGILFELLSTLDTENELLLENVENRSKFEEGNFFTSVPKADVYILKRIIHDWTDDQCITLLKNCFNSIKNNGKVVILESIVPEGSFKHLSKSDDILMMSLCTGRERTISEFEHLANLSGFKIDCIKNTPTQLSILELLPKIWLKLYGFLK